MYTILITQDHKLIPTHKERIVECSKNVNTLCFLANKICDGVEISDCNVKLQYILPISKEYHSEDLILSDELYNEMLIYTFPIDADFTKEAGNIEAKLTFTKKYIDEDGNEKEYLRRTSPTRIPIVPITFAEDVPDIEIDEDFSPISEEDIISLFK